MKKIYFVSFCFFIFFISIFAHKIHAAPYVPGGLANPALQNSGGVVSQCAVVKVGDPKEDPDLSSCQQSSSYSPGGIGYNQPSIMTPHPFKMGYFQLPKSQPGNYKIYTCPGRTWGSKELIGVLHTVSERWKQLYPQGFVSIGDLNATGHKSHKWGRAVDLDATTNSKDCVADYTTTIFAGSISCSDKNYNRQATIELGKMLVDTNMVRAIWYNDQTVNRAVLEYAAQTGRSKNMRMKPIIGHTNHFHLDIEIPLLSVWEPGC